MRQLARAILAYDPFPDTQDSDESKHPLQTLSLQVRALHWAFAVVQHPHPPAMQT